MNFEVEEGCVEPTHTSNVLIGAVTCAYARIRLYSYLERIQDKIIYVDTDSAFFIDCDDDPCDIPVGKFLGDMTDELECYGTGSYVIEFVSGGPKNYSYKVFSTNTNSIEIVCKVKGFRLNWDISKTINFETIKNMVLKPSDDPIKIIEHGIKRTSGYEIITQTREKIYRPVFQKRIFENFDSSPFGYKKKASSDKNSSF